MDTYDNKFKLLDKYINALTETLELDCIIKKLDVIPHTYIFLIPAVTNTFELRNQDITDKGINLLQSWFSFNNINACIQKHYIKIDRIVATFNNSAKLNTFINKTQILMQALQMLIRNGYIKSNMNLQITEDTIQFDIIKGTKQNIQTLFPDIKIYYTVATLTKRSLSRLIRNFQASMTIAKLNDLTLPVEYDVEYENED